MAGMNPDPREAQLMLQFHSFPVRTALNKDWIRQHYFFCEFSEHEKNVTIGVSGSKFFIVPRTEGNPTEHYGTCQVFKGKLQRGSKNLEHNMIISHDTLQTCDRFPTKSTHEMRCNR